MASQNATCAPERRRGRPSGKNRTPLSSEERRSRNAEYERERRAEQAKLLSQIAESIGCDPNATTLEILDTVINYLKQFEKTDVTGDIHSLRRINNNLINQIASCEQRLGIPSGSELEDDSYEYIRTHSNNVGSKRMKLEDQADLRSDPVPQYGSLPQGLISTNGFSFHDNPLPEVMDLLEVDHVLPVPDFMQEWSIDDFVHTYLNTSI